MSHSSYTSSERRGILAIVILSLLLIGGGVVLGLCGRNKEIAKEIPVVIEHPEMKDSTFVNKDLEKTSIRKNKKGKVTSSKEKTKKTFRRRSPLDEPVSE